MIAGIQKLTLLDYPGKVACTVFTAGCQLRCPFCHNASLVLPEKFGATLPTEEFFAFLESRRGKLRAVCVSGGEPTMQGNFVLECMKLLHKAEMRTGIETSAPIRIDAE